MAVPAVSFNCDGRSNKSLTFTPQLITAPSSVDSTKRIIETERFVLIMILTIGSYMIISIKENQLHFGILKSIGWTPGQIRMSMVWKILCIAVTVTLVAIPTAIWISPVLMGQVTGSIGLIKFPFVVNYPGMLMSIPLTLVLISACTWWLSRGAASTNPRTLINS